MVHRKKRSILQLSRAPLDEDGLIFLMYCLV